MANPGINLEALENFQTDDLRKLIESLQGLAAARTGDDAKPAVPNPPHIPVITAGEEEAILW